MNPSVDLFADAIGTLTNGIIPNVATAMIALVGITFIIFSLNLVLRSLGVITDDTDSDDGSVTEKSYLAYRKKRSTNELHAYMYKKEKSALMNEERKSMSRHISIKGGGQGF